MRQYTAMRAPDMRQYTADMRQYTAMKPQNTGMKPACRECVLCRACGRVLRSGPQHPASAILRPTADAWLGGVPPGCSTCGRSHGTRLLPPGQTQSWYHRTGQYEAVAATAVLAIRPGQYSVHACWYWDGMHATRYTHRLIAAAVRAARTLLDTPSRLSPSGT
eukprot:2178263-Rhodomonas_salina.2